MRLTPFEQSARTACPSHAHLALSLAQEFRTVDVELVVVGLNSLANGLRHLRLADPREQLEALGDSVLGAGLRVGGGSSLEELWLDRALANARCHHTVLAIVGVEVGQRAGLPVEVVGGPQRHLVIHAGLDTPLLLDPVVGRLVPAEEVAEELRWCCAHATAMTLLDEAVRRADRVGDLATVLRAAQLRLLLPVEEQALERRRQQLRTLLARLN